MSLRTQIDLALEAIQYDFERPGRGLFRSAAIALGSSHLTVRFGSAGREVVLSTQHAKEVRISRWGAVTEVEPVSAPQGGAVSAAAHAMSQALGSTHLSWRRERTSWGLESSLATTVVLADERLGRRVGRLLALRVSTAQRALALTAIADLMADSVELSVAAAAGELLPELFVTSGRLIGGVELSQMAWFPPVVPAVGDFLARDPAVRVHLAISAELGLGLTLEVQAAGELPPYMPLPHSPPALAILAAATQGGFELEPQVRVGFQNSLLSNDIAPLPGRTPSACRAYARGLGRWFSRTGTLSDGRMPPAVLMKVSRQALRVGMARSIVAR